MMLVLSVLTQLALVPAVFFLAEIIGAYLPARPHEKTVSTTIPPTRTTIVIPAHNESTGIIPTLEDCLRDRQPSDQILVVADNCTDDTASAVASFFDGHDKVTLLERNDTQQRGKGFALAFGLAALRSAPPDIVVFLDADCRLQTGALDMIVARASQTGRPVQALYLMDRPQNSDSASRKQGVAAFAWLLMNKIRMRGLFRLFDVTRLTGSGMAFPFPLLRDHFTGSASIVEDLALTVQMTRLGVAPIFEPRALVTSTLPASDKGMVVQRARWERGSISMLTSTAWPLLREGLRAGDLRRIALAIDIAIPPLTLFIAGLLLLSGLLFVPALFGASFPLMLTLMTLVVVISAIGFVWWSDGRSLLPPGELRGLAEFLLQKLQIHGEKGRHSAEQWTRTDRD